MARPATAHRRQGTRSAPPRPRRPTATARPRRPKPVMAFAVSHPECRAKGAPLRRGQSRKLLDDRPQQGVKSRERKVALDPRARHAQHPHPLRAVGRVAKQRRLAEPRLPRTTNEPLRPSRASASKRSTTERSRSRPTSARGTLTLPPMARTLAAAACTKTRFVAGRTSSTARSRVAKVSGRAEPDRCPETPPTRSCSLAGSPTTQSAGS